MKKEWNRPNLLELNINMTKNTVSFGAKPDYTEPCDCPDNSHDYHVYVKS